MFFMMSLAYSQDWKINLNEAKKIAQDNNQKIVLVFSGSDWCAPCIKMEKEIWSTQVFKNYAKDNYVMLKADFPRRKKNALSETQQNHNNKLAELYNKNGFFPLVVVLDNQGKVLGKTGYKKTTPESFIKGLNTY